MCAGEGEAYEERPEQAPEVPMALKYMRAHSPPLGDEDGDQNDHHLHRQHTVSSGSGDWTVSSGSSDWSVSRKCRRDI